MGGTLMAAINHMTHRVLKSGTDPTRLGRWSWIQFQGKQGMRLRVEMIYRPVESAGVLSTYQQHLRYYRSLAR
jgi:hypothetical protein